MITENEMPKYLKSTESNISKSNRKSKHKHHYEECLIQYKWNFKSNAFTQEEKRTYSYIIMQLLYYLWKNWRNN